jgi:hypothetical protein
VQATGPTQVYVLHQPDICSAGNTKERTLCARQRPDPHPPAKQAADTTLQKLHTEGGGARQPTNQPTCRMRAFLHCQCWNRSSLGTKQTDDARQINSRLNHTSHDLDTPQKRTTPGGLRHQALAPHCLPDPTQGAGPHTNQYHLVNPVLCSTAL